MNRETVKYSFISSLPVMAGYIVLGIGFGVLLADKGYSSLWAILMSVLIYAGSLQYVGVGLLGGGASLISAGLMTLMVNARHLFYGVSMLKRYEKLGGIKKLYAIFALTDETYSLVCSTKVPEHVDEKWYYFLVSMMNQSYWVFGSFLGAFLGNALSFDSTGIDFSMTALFVVIFVEQWEGKREHIPALSGLGISVVCLLVFGADYFLIPAMILITTALLLAKKPLERRAQHD